MRHTPCGCRSAHLVEVRSNSRLPPVSTMRRAQQCRYFARSLPPRERHSRLTIVRRGCWMCRNVGIHGEAMYTAPDYPQGVCHIRKAAELPTAVQCAARAVLQDKNCQCAGSRGKAPCVLLGDLKGAILFCEREWPPFITPWCDRTKRPHGGSARCRWRRWSRRDDPAARHGSHGAHRRSSARA